MIHNSFFNRLHRIAFFLLLALLPTQLGFHTWPSWALVLGRRVDYLSPTLYLTDILIFLIIFFWFTNFISRIMKHELRIMAIIHNSLFIILLFLFALLNIFFADSPMVALYKWAKVLEFGLLGVYIVKTKQTIKRIIFPLTIGVLYSSVIAIAQFILQRSVGGPLWLLGERVFSNQTPGIAQFYFHQLWLRAYGTFPHPNVLGGYLAALLPLIIYQFTNSKKYFFVTAIVLGYVALLLTCSRSAWAAGGIAIAFALARIMNYESRIMKKLFVVSITAFILYSLFFILYSTDESGVVRRELNASAILMWTKHPLIGVGLGNYLTELPNYLVSRQIYFLQPVHNIYLLVLSEAGLIGVSIISYFSYFYLKHELRIMNHGKNKTQPSFIIHYSLFIILLLGLVDHYPLTLQQGQLLLTLLLAMCVIQLPHADTD